MENKRNPEVSILEWNKASLPIGKFNNRISTIIATIAVATLWEVLAETPLQFSAPVKISGPWTEVFAWEGGKSRIFTSHIDSYNAQATTISEMKISVSPWEAGPYGGMLTVSGFMRIISGSSDAHTWEGFSNLVAMIKQELIRGFWEEIRRTGDSNQGIFFNDADAVFDGPNEGIDESRKFSFTIPVSSSGVKYTIQNIANVGWSDATVILAGDVEGNEPLNVSYIPYQTNPDTNSNDIFDDWEIVNFGNADPGANRPQDDPDNDGMSNLEEYAFNQDPLSQSLSSIQYNIKENYSHIFLWKNLQARNVVYIPEVSTDLKTWTSTDSDLLETNRTSYFSFIDFKTTSPEKRFYRIRIEAK
jgi:hypothetical protein